MANIRWCKQDITTLSKAVRNFNAKIKRVTAKNPYIADIQPQKLSLKQLRQDIQTRQDFKRVLTDIQSYSIRGAENPYITKKGVNITNYEKEKIDRQFKLINKARKAEIRKYQPSEYRGTKQLIETENLKPLQNTIERVLPRDWAKFTQNLEKQVISGYTKAKQELYKSNYIQAIRNNLGGNSRLINIIQRIPADLLTELLFKNPILHIDFIYSPEDAEEIEELIISSLAAEGCAN